MHGYLVVAVDQGKSGTRAEAWAEGGAERQSVSPGSEPGSSGADAVVDAVEGLRLLRPPDVLGIGSTAAPGSLAERREQAAELRRRLGAGRVLLTEDAITAHLGAFRGGPGVVVSAGTGAVALWSDGQSCARVDGLGPVLGDHGSGADIGRAGLRAALAAAEGRGVPTSLVEPARGHLGGLGLSAARRLHEAANPTELVSDFAVAVVLAAEEGDEVAGAIIARAADDLATSAALAARPALGRGGRPRCCTVGRLMRSEALGAAFAKRATELGLAVTDAQAGALVGARMLATHGPGPAFTDLVGVAGP